MGIGPRSEWSLKRLLRQAGVTPVSPDADIDVPISTLTCDSRNIIPGACFVALRGAAHDGHAFVAEAFDRGAAAAIVEAPVGDQLGPLIQVSDTHLALSLLAASFHRIDLAQAEGRLRIVGVTGTNGKTTVCALVHGILAAAGRQSALLGTVANDFGRGRMASNMTTLPPVELCAALADAAAAGMTDAVLEVSSHALDQRRCDGLRFAAGIFTNLTQDHLDYHLDMESYARAKRRLFEQLDASAIAVIHADDPWAAFMADGTSARVVRYAVEQPSDHAEVTARVTSADVDGTQAWISVEGQCFDLRTTLIGRHNLSNILAAAAAAHGLEIPLDAIRAGLADFKGVRGRLERVGGAGAPIAVFVDYAHTPDALEHVLRVLRSVTSGRLICVFGCGGDRDRGKRPLMGRIAAETSDVAVVTSDNPRGEDPEAIIDQVLSGMAKSAGCRVVRLSDRRTAIHEAICLARPGDTVLIAGKGHEDYQIIGGRRLNFDDASVAREALGISGGMQAVGSEAVR